MTARPAPLPEHASPELVRTVVETYRRRVGLVPEYHAWIAARDATRRLRPELDEAAAGLLATRILAEEAAISPAPRQERR
jgi:hypothetical protein